MKQKGLAPILIVLLIAVVVSGYLIYQKQKPTIIPQQITQSTPVPTFAPESSTSADIANWKVFKNDNYQFSYPQSWYLKNSNGSQLFYTSQEDAKVGAPTFIMIVSSYDKKLLTGKISFADPVGTKKETADKVFTIKTKDLTVGSHSAFETKSEVFSGSQTDVRPTISVYIDSGNQKTLSISMTLQNDSESNEEIFNQILSTFKFL